MPGRKGSGRVESENRKVKPGKRSDASCCICPLTGSWYLAVAISGPSESFEVGMLTIHPRSYRDLRPKPGSTEVSGEHYLSSSNTYPFVNR